jgi:hypothetical protein
VITAEAELQRLKPLRSCGVYVVAKATTHKDSRGSTRDFQGPEKDPGYTRGKRRGL